MVPQLAPPCGVARVERTNGRKAFIPADRLVRQVDCLFTGVGAHASLKQPVTLATLVDETDHTSAECRQYRDPNARAFNRSPCHRQYSAIARELAQVLC